MSKHRTIPTTSNTTNPNRVTGERKKLPTGHQAKRNTIIMSDARTRRERTRKKSWNDHLE